MSSRFSTLLLREWMQHKRGWLITLLLPPMLFLALLPFGQANGMPTDHRMAVVAVIIVMISTLALAGIAWVSAMFQLSGLARRDSQDRSIEFWLSLPASHSESIGATLLSHVLLVPLVALPIGFAFGGLIASGLVIKQAGWAAWTQVPWLLVLVNSLPLLLRAMFGLLLASLWLAPLMMIVMVASAWLKRWGVPAVALTLGIGGVVLDKVYQNPIVWQVLGAQFTGANRAFLHDAGQDTMQWQQVADLLGTAQGGSNSAQWALADALGAVQDLASPNLVIGLLVAAAGFALLVFKRSRSA